MRLVIVESPTKARKLRQYLGAEYQIEASVGHIRDLPKSELAIDLEHDFAPKYVIAEEKRRVSAHLRREASKAEVVILATDPDREGEAIAWHLQEILGGKVTQFQRATFFEITKAAIQKAIAEPSELNLALVNAQQARRVVDRLVGYQVSPVLWRKVRRGLSAGRVQSVALRLIVERELEIEAFQAEEYWELEVALFLEPVKKAPPLFYEQKAIEPLPKGCFVLRLIELNGHKYGPRQEAEVTPVVAWLPSAHYQVETVEKKERRVVSLPPFTTSTLQQSAATRLGFTSKQTMMFAQQLYEEGMITYHRTDSVNLASSAVAEARAWIEQQFGAEYVPATPRYFANRSKNAQEAHEAIRVTVVERDSVLGQSNKLSERHQKLYDLIRRRFIASQMEAARYDQANLVVRAESTQTKTAAETEWARLKATGSVLQFAGWRRLFPVAEEVALPAVAPQQPLYFGDLSANQKFTQPPPRYNDASLVKELEKRGIGRPSTYASIISLILERGYVEREAKRFLPTSIGRAVCQFLITHFAQLMAYEFTAEMEEDLDRIARGEKEWVGVVREFYQPFHQLVEKALVEAERVKLPVEQTGEICPECGQTEGGEIVIRVGKYGKFKSCSRFPECKFTQNIVNLLEGVLCPLCGEGTVVARKSRWGKLFYGCARYPQCDWASWQKPEPGLRIAAAEWAEQQAKRAERRAAREAKQGQSKTSSASKQGKKKTAGKTKLAKSTQSARAKSTKTKSTKTKSTKTKLTKATTKSAKSTQSTKVTRVKSTKSTIKSTRPKTK